MQENGEKMNTEITTKKPLRKLNVAAYARVSTDDEDQANSYASQVSYFTEYIQSREDWTFAGVYADEGISGTSTRKRDSFNRLIADAESGLIDLIITKEVSRFARNTVDTLSITRALKKRGVHVLFVNDNINTGDNDGELRLSIMATIAQDESRKTSERVKWGQKRRMEQGVVFGRDMLGYAVRGGKLYLKEDEAEVVRLIFHKYANEGKGTHVIARELREAGIRPIREKDWSNTVILRVLKNEKYVGDLCQKKTITPDFLDHAKKYNHGEEDMVYIRDHHPDIAIIDRDLWGRTQEELARRALSQEQKSKYSNRYWCSGKLVCGLCGGRLVSHTKHLKNGTLYKTWNCLETIRSGRAKIDGFGNRVGCDCGSIADKTLKALVSFSIEQVLCNSENIKSQLLRDIAEISDIRKKQLDEKALQSEIARLQKKKARVIDLAVDSVISNADAKIQNEMYSEQIYDLQRRLADARQADATQENEIQRYRRYIERMDSLLGLDVTDEALIKEVFRQGVLHPNRCVDIYLSFVPFGFRICYETSGRMDLFTVKVLSFDMID